MKLADLAIRPYARALAPPLPKGRKALEAEVWRLREEVYLLNHVRLEWAGIEYTATPPTARIDTMKLLQYDS